MNVEHLIILGVDLNCWPGEQQLHKVVVTANLQEKEMVDYIHHVDHFDLRKVELQMVQTTASIRGVVLKSPPLVLTSSPLSRAPLFQLDPCF